VYCLVLCVSCWLVCVFPSLRLVFCCFVSRNAVFEVLFCSCWFKPARVFWRKCQTCMYEGVCERRAHSYCFLVVMWGQRSFVCLVHLSGHRHQKSWRCVERRNQRAQLWLRVRGRVRKVGTFLEGVVCTCVMFASMFFYKMQCLGV
jgi:hypothetical protein